MQASTVATTLCIKENDCSDIVVHSPIECYSARLRCCASVCHIVNDSKGALVVVFEAPRDAGRSCRCRPFYLFRGGGMEGLEVQTAHTYSASWGSSTEIDHPTWTK